jgi:hypothetical protein
MRARLTKLMAGLMAISAMAFGGAAIAGAASKTPPVNPPPATVGVQQGDQTTPDLGGSSAESSSESASGPETASEEGASESPEANDGPGGHMDEPGNAGAQYQFQGAQ